MEFFSSDVVRLSNVKKNRRAIQTIDVSSTRFENIFLKSEIFKDLICNVYKVIFCL